MPNSDINKFGISVRCLGAFDLRIDDHPVTRWRGGKSCNLLQFMLLREGRVVSREVLHDALWPGRYASRGSSSLKVAVHMLRNVIVADREAAKDRSSIRLETCEAGYILRTSNVWVDFQIFDRLISEGQQAGARGDRIRASAAFRDAIKLYQGDFLPEVIMEWAEAHREWLRSRALLALEWLTRDALDVGDNFAVIYWCQQILEIDPYHEEAYCRLMRVHAQLGHLDQVRRWYALCHSRLESGLGVTPATATRKLLADALRGDLLQRCDSR